MLRFIAHHCSFLAALLACARVTTMAHAAQTIDLSPKIEPGQIVRVSIDFEAGGNQLVRIVAPAKQPTPPNNPSGEVAAARGPTDQNATAANNEKQLPASVVATLQYDERRLSALNAKTAKPGTQLALRYYDRAEETIKVDQSGVAPKLANSRRLVVVEQGPDRPRLYSTAGPLPRDELDLIDCIGNSTLLEQLLPTHPVAQGDSWPTDAATIGAWLTLDAVTVCEASSVLEEFNATFAKVRLAGVVHGTADGTPTEQEIRAVYLFDRRLGRITRVNIAAREKRSIGGATPGLDAVAKLQMKIEPANGSPNLNEAAVASAAAGRALHSSADILCDQPTLGFRTTHDRQWFITSQSRESIILRRVDRDELVATCAVSLLPAKSAGHQTTLEQFQKDVVFALGQNFGELVSARQWTSPHDHLCFEVIARGLVEEVPIEWHYFLIAQETGHRIGLTVTTEAPMLDRLGQADRSLVQAVELYPPLPPTTAALAPATIK